ncbi:hypothetical protein Bca4012_085000 [Brassica carinata]
MRNFFLPRHTSVGCSLSDFDASSLPSNSERSSSSAPHLEIKEGIESDEEIRRVAEFGGEATGKEIIGRESGSGTSQDQTQIRVGGEGQRKRGRTPAEKETKRLKRLLRNRVSAQQARERKKAYLGELENRVKDLENRNSELEERLSTLQNENQMLRQRQRSFRESLLKIVDTLQRSHVMVELRGLK